ncbi:MAG: transglycosylase SLT domain-containing protein [Nitrospinae bacterium]|nr:transglycosylase SLT domain-containing protein [Nitrospinota bacterium]
MESGDMRLKIILTGLAGGLLLSVAPAKTAHAGEFFMLKDARGVVYFTDQPPAPGSRARVIRRYATSEKQGSSAPGEAYTAPRYRNFSGQYDHVIQEAARRQGLDPLILKAVMKVESDFNPYAVSSKGEMLNRFSGDLRLALAAYNAGPTAVEQHRGVPPFNETRRYLQKVQAAYASLSGRPYSAPSRVEAAANTPGGRISSAVYVYRDDRGRLVLTDMPKGQRYAFKN